MHNFLLTMNAIIMLRIQCVKFQGVKFQGVKFQVNLFSYLLDIYMFIKLYVCLCAPYRNSHA